LKNNKVQLDLFIFKSVKIPIDSTLTFSQDSLLGGKSILITLGSSSTMLKLNEVISSNITSTSLSDIGSSVSSAANEFRTLISKFNNLVDEDLLTSLDNTIKNIENISSNLNSVLDETKLNAILDNINNLALNASNSAKSFGDMSGEFKLTASTINKDLPSLLKELKLTIKNFKQTSASLNENIPQIASNLNEILEENKVPLNNTITAAGDFFSTGKKTLSVVDGYIEKLNQTKLEVSLESHYMAQDKFNESSFAVNFITNPTKSYMFEVTSTDDYSEEDTNGNLIEPDIHDEGKFLISAQMAKRYKDYRLRAGLIKSTGGLGIDYYSFNDKLQSSIQAYDFNSQNDLRSKRLTLDLGVRYEIAEYIDAYAGIRNAINSNRNAYIGLGIRFIDDDLKTLLGSAGGLGSLAK
ncbi:MAG: Phospholipid/cholesterol/gamma-HCH transport system substrate-binding protein, partial [uncultured Campylobacterales bacterium]